MIRKISYALLLLPSIAWGQCSGKFVNPISDICWSCMLPMTIGNTQVLGKKDNHSMQTSKRRDTKNPVSPVCSCITNGVHNAVGVTIGYWEPFRLVDITYEPYCFVGLGGIKIQLGSSTQYGTDEHARTDMNSSFAHTHLYVYPITYLMNLISDAICSDMTDFGIAYMSEIDPSYLDEFLSTFMFPESLLFANAIGEMSCIKDCVQSTIGMPDNNMFWCAGCQGGIYPIVGWSSSQYSYASQIALLTQRLIFKMHRSGVFPRTSTNDSSPNGKLCRPSVAPTVKRSQYKLQLTFPASGSSRAYSQDVMDEAAARAFSRSNENQCTTLGMDSHFFAPDAESIKFNGNAGVMIWRKRNCCAF